MKAGRYSRVLQVIIAVLWLRPAGAYGQVGQWYPIARDTADNFKDSLVLEGKIESVAGFDPQCGVRCNCKTFVVKLTAECAGYPHSHLYAAFTCAHRITKKDLRKVLRLQLVEIAMDDESCYWKAPQYNPFDSQGLPFYRLVGHTIKK